MAEEVLSESLLNELSKECYIALYPPNGLSIHLGLAIKEKTRKQTELPRQQPNPAEGQGRTVNEVRPSDVDAFATDRSTPQQGDQPSVQTSHLRKVIAAVCITVLVVLGALLIGYITISESKKCVPPCQNGGTCNKSDGTYFCTCDTGFGGDSCEIEYISETFTLHECQELLREYYEDHLFKIHLKPWDPHDYVDLENLFSTVSLYRKDKNNFPDKPLQKLTLNGSVNDIFRTKTGGSLPKRIVLFGEAGRGKTTAVAKIAYDWATKKEDSPLKNIKLLFVFKMRNMDKNTEISEAVVRLLGKKYKKYETKLEEYIDSHEKDIVILFDGYDEFSGEINAWGRTGGVIDILRQERCRRCRVLVTSRPLRMKDFNSRNFLYSKMVIEGYSQQHARDFINKFFLSNETKGTELNKYLEEDIVTNEMIATPLFCTMACYLWNEGYIPGNFTRTKLFDDIMEFLRKRLNVKNEQDKNIEQSLLNDTVVSVGQVAFMKLNARDDQNPLLFSEDDFSGIHEEKVNISFSLGLLTKNRKTDSDIIIYVEFFYKLAQEYSAGRYLASSLYAGSVIPFNLSEVVFKEILRFASGTSDSACRKILAFILRKHQLSCLSDEVYLSLILDIISETGTCAEQSKTNLSQLFTHGKFRLSRVSASTVVGFKKLPGSVKEKITSVEISGVDSLWLPRVPWDIPSSFSLTMTHMTRIMACYLPNIRELVIHNTDFPFDEKFARTSDVFGQLWNKLNSSQPSLSRLLLPIPNDMTSNLKQLTSIRVFETKGVLSVKSLARVLTFLPRIVELVVEGSKPLSMDYFTDAYCELWKNLHTSPSLISLLLPIPIEIKCDLDSLEPLLSVQVFETKSPSSKLPDILKNLPNLQKLLIDLRTPGYPEIDEESSHIMFNKLWKRLHDLHQLRHLKMKVPYIVPASHLQPLQSVETFQTEMTFEMKVFLKLLSGLPNLTQLDIAARNMCLVYRDRLEKTKKVVFLRYYDDVVLTIINGLKDNVRLEVLNMTFDSPVKPSDTVSHDTVHKLIQMLKSSDRMRQLQIISFNYCVFNELDLVEIATAIIALTSIELLKLDCSLDYEGELFQYAIQHNQRMEEDGDINMESGQSGPLRLTLFFWDPEMFARRERNFVLPRSDSPS